MQPTEYKRMTFQYEDRGGKEEVDQAQLRPQGEILFILARSHTSMSKCQKIINYSSVS